MTRRTALVVVGVGISVLMLGCNTAPYVATSFPANYAAFDPDCGTALEAGEQENARVYRVCTRLKASFEKIQSRCQVKSGWQLGMRGVKNKPQIEDYNSCMEEVLFESGSRSLWIRRPTPERVGFRNLVGIGCSKALGCQEIRRTTTGAS